MNIQYMSTILLTVLILPFLSCSTDVSAPEEPTPIVETASYTVTFEATWSEDTHPQDYPSNSHFSKLIGATHNTDVTFWEEDELASPGIESMAETGGISMLTSEVEQAISKNTAFSVLEGGGIGSSPGSVSVNFDINKNYPLVTLVSMVAPSPDWFVGVNKLSLIENRQWVDELTVKLYSYDSGTDSGTNYTSPNKNTDPAEPIFRPEEPPFKDGNSYPPMGTFTFIRQK